MKTELTVKNLDYWKKNAEEDYIKVPISVLRYITELENFNPQQEVVSDEMIQGSEDMIAERLHGELTINDEEIINEHPHLVKNIKDAMRSYSELCQKELIKKLSSPKTSRN